MGQLRKRGNVWWIRYYRDGQRFEESARTDKKEKARDLLRQREGAIANGAPVSAKIGRLRFEDASADLINDYTVNAKKTTADVTRRIDLHLKPFFRGRRMSTITTVDVRTFIKQRQDKGASNGEINRELTALKRMFSLALQAGKLLHRPHIPMLFENNVRTGFFEPQQFAIVLSKLRPGQRTAAKFAYLTGWRLKSEVLKLEWRQVDFEAGEVRLDPGQTKNGEGRVFPTTRELRTLLKDREAVAKGMKEQGKIMRYVFHRANGKPIRSFRKQWAKACIAAGCPGRVPHDLRRTAVREFVRRGVPERVAMMLCGHRTGSVFDRYSIVSEGDLRAAASKSTRRGQFRGQLTMRRRERANDRHRKSHVFNAYHSRARSSAG